MANIEQVLTQIALTFSLDADELIAFSYEDEIGGYHSTPSLALWPSGNIWGVEGRVLYALVRAVKPKTFYNSTETDDCAQNHMGMATAKTGIGSMLLNLNSGMATNTIDFIFLDNIQSPDDVKAAWIDADARLNPGGFIVMHDATHFLVGAGIQQGIQASGIQGVQLYDIQPSDCGLAVWRKPGAVPTKASAPADDYDRFIPVTEPTQPSFEYRGLDPYIVVVEEPDYDLDSMTRAELRAFAEDHGIDLGDLRAKTDIRAAIDAALGEV